MSDAEEGSVSEMKAGLERDGVEDCGGEEDGDGVYLSEPEGETELDPPASESEDGYSMHTASSSQLHTTADSVPSSPASSQLYVLKLHIIKGIVHPKMKILSLITHHHVVPNP